MDVLEVKTHAIYVVIPVETPQKTVNVISIFMMIYQIIKNAKNVALNAIYAKIRQKTVKHVLIPLEIYPLYAHAVQDSLKKIIQHAHVIYKII